MDAACRALELIGPPPDEESQEAAAKHEADGGAQSGEEGEE
jgi:hypothetical protein